MPSHSQSDAVDRTDESNAKVAVTRRGVLKTGGAGLGSLALFGGFTGTGAASESIKTPRLSTESNWLVDPRGNRVVLRGVNVEDPYWAYHYDDKNIPTKMEEATTGEWYSRVIRVPCETKRIEEAGGVQAYAEDFLDPLVDKAEELRVYLIIDYHEIARWDDPAVHSKLETFWDAVAPRYADREHVLYELFNEPSAPGGGSLDTWRDWRDTAQPWVDSIREDAPETPIIVGSPRYCQVTHHADDAPFEGDDLIYAAHVYPYHFHNSVDMHDLSVTASNVPVMITEWGYENDENRSEHMIGTTSDYGQGMREWFADNPSVGWTPWCYSRQYAPRMWDDDWNLRGGDDYMGEYVKNFLYETRHDHRPGTSSGASPRPTAPSNLSSPSQESTSVTLEWDPSSHPSAESSDSAGSKGNGSWLDHYNVYLEGDKVQEVSSTSATVSDLSSATNYDFYVTAVDRSGRESDWSNLVPVTTDFSGNLANTNSTADPPQIDGARDDLWDGAEALPVDNDLAGSPSDSNLDATAYTLYDADNVYVFVEVTDDADAQDSDALYQDDSVEVYLDVGKDNETGYTDDDYQYQFRRDGSTLAETKHDATADVAWATTETSAGYNLEVAFPHTTTGAAPSDGDMLGFDVHVNDDDDGGNRDAKVAWSATSDNSWQDPSTFGTLSFNFTDGGDTDATAPTTPTNLSAPSKTDTTVDLSWNVSDDDGGSGLDHYNVYVDGSKDHEVAAGTTSTTVDGLSTDTRYDFHVTAVDGAGNESGSSNVVTELAGGDLAAPTAPSNLTSPTNDSSSVDLSWVASSDTGGSGLDHYNVYVDGSKDHEVAAGTTSTIVDGLSAGSVYEFHVTAVDGVGNESDPSYSLTETTEGSGGDGPTAPANLSSPSHTDTTVDLDWDATNEETDMDYYTVWVDGDVVQWIPPGTTSTTVTDLTPGTRYDFYVIVTIDGAPSPPSDTVTVTTN